MKNLVTGTIVAIALSLSFAASAQAYPHHGYHGHRGNHFGVSFYSGPAYYPYYAPRYYEPVYSYVPVEPIYESAPPPPPQPIQDISDNGYCREYQGRVRIDGRSQPTYGTACLQPDGTWQLVN